MAQKERRDSDTGILEFMKVYAGLWMAPYEVPLLWAL